MPLQTHVSPGGIAYPRDTNGKTLFMLPDNYTPFFQISSADTNVRRLHLGSESANPNDSTANTAGAEASFTMTGIDTTNLRTNALAGWVLEIVEAGYEQRLQIKSHTAASPGVATLTSNFSPALPSGNIEFIVWPYMVTPWSIRADAGCTGTLSLYSGDTADALNTLDVIPIGGGSLTLYLTNPSRVYYAFSVNAATEIFRVGPVF